MGHPNDAILIDQIVCGPIIIMERIPSGIVIIQGDRISNSKMRDGFFYIVGLFFEFKLWSVHPDNYKSIIFIIAVPIFYMGKRADAIDAAVGPKIYQDHFST